MDRLPRESFDVIPPAERVQGERGDIRIWQKACRVGPTNWARRRIVDIAVQEWAFFGFQTIDATQIDTRQLPSGLVPDTLNPALPSPRIDERFLRLGLPETARAMDATIAGYWSATPDGEKALLTQNRAWNGPGGRDVDWLEPWSAAFVSWVMCEAGLGDMAQFARDVSHRVYVDQAIAARDSNNATTAYVAYDSGETDIAPGDLLCVARGSADYRKLSDRRKATGEYAPTHCDIVVKTDAAAKRIFVIGGNVGDAVSLTILPATNDGRHLHPIDSGMIADAHNVFAHLKLRADAVEMNALDNTPTIKALQSAPPLRPFQRP